MKPTVAVIIPTYNRAHCVGEAIQSVLDQTVPADEILVIDDGSTDNTPEVLAAFGNRITVITQPNRGVSAARNAGIARATSEWLTFLDSDDLWYPNRLSVLHRDISSTGSSTGAHLHVANFDLIGPGYRRQMFDLAGLAAPSANAAEVSDSLGIVSRVCSTLGLATQRRLALAVSGFEEGLSFGEDLDFASKLAIRGRCLVTSAVIGAALRRVGDAAESLTYQASLDIAKSKGNHTQIFERLLTFDGLTPVQRRALLLRLSGARYLYAQALYEGNRRAEARRALLQSAREHPSVKGWLKAIPPLVLGALGYRVVAMRHQRGFFREDYDTQQADEPPFETRENG